MNNRKRFWLIFELAVILIGGSLHLMRQYEILPSAGALNGTAVIVSMAQENSGE